MKKISTLLIFSLLGYTLTAQTVRRVNGDPSITGVNVYNTIQAAVDAANTDDIILIEPYGENESQNPAYGEEIHVDKRLHFRGNGYNLDNPNLSISLFDKRPANLNSSLSLELGSAGSSVKNLFGNYLNLVDSNILIESCSFASVYLNSLENSNLVISHGINPQIRKSLISYITDNRGTKSKSLAYLNLTLENSIVSGIAYLSNSIFKNNIINYSSYTHNSIFTNCIFQSKIVGSPGGSNYNNAISYCISFDGDLPALGNNINNVAWQQVFKGQSYLGRSYTNESHAELSNSSLGKNAGINGGDIGIYGGTYPYEKSGLPHHPITTDFLNSGIGNDEIDIDGVVSIEAN